MATRSDARARKLLAIQDQMHRHIRNDREFLATFLANLRANMGKGGEG